MQLTPKLGQSLPANRVQISLSNRLPCKINAVLSVSPYPPSLGEEAPCRALGPVALGRTTFATKRLQVEHYPRECCRSGVTLLTAHT